MTEESSSQVAADGKGNSNQLTLSTVRSFDYLNFFGGLNVSNYPFKYKKLYTIYTMLCNFVTYVLFPFSFAIQLTKAANYEVGAFLVIIETFYNVCGTAAKSVCITLMISGLHKVNDVLHVLDARCKDEDEVKEQARAIKIGRRFALTYAVWDYIFLVLTFSGSYLKQRTPYTLYLAGIDWHRSKLEFHLAFYLEMFFFACIVAQTVCCDGYAVVYIAVLGAHMRILVLRVSKLGKNAELSFEENMERLRACIEDYLQILKLRNLIAPLISRTIFVQYMVMALACSTVLIHVFILPTSAEDQMGSVLYIFAVSFQSFPTCYYATQLEEDSSRISTEIFGSEWFGQSRKYRQMMMTFMHQSQKAMRFTAATIFEISLPMFITVAKLSFSLYTFARKLDLKTKLGF